MLRFIRKQRTEKRRGVAAVELAVASPMLVILILGSIDMGQFINVGQVVSNSSRVGARKASQFDTIDTTAVQTAVYRYFAEYFPDLSDAQIAGACTVTVTDASGTSISGATLAAMPSGSQLAVTVQFNYDAVRWFSGMSYLSGKTITVTTTMRRQ